MVPVVLHVVLAPLFSTVTKDCLNLVLLLHRRRICVICHAVRVVFELFEILDIVHVVRNLVASARHADLVTRRSRPLLFLRACTIVGVGIRVRSRWTGSDCAHIWSTPHAGKGATTYLWVWTVLSSSWVPSSSAHHTPHPRTTHLPPRRRSGPLVHHLRNPEAGVYKRKPKRLTIRRAYRVVLILHLPCSI